MISRRKLLNIGFLGAFASALGACSSLTLFNNLTPKDKESEKLATNLPYGENARQSMDIYGPRVGSANLGTIVFFYGGGWNSGKKEDYSWAGRSLAALGYVVFVPDYRLYPEVKYPDFVNDSAKALNFIVENGAKFGAKTTDIVLIGHSAGAYNAAMLAINDDFSGAAFKNIKAFIGISGPYDFYPFDVSESINAFGDFPNPKITQPVNLVKKSNIEYLLLHSKPDKIVGIYNSRNLAKALLNQGQKVQLIEYENPSHQEMIAALSIPFRSKADVRAQISKFLQKPL